MKRARDSSDDPDITHENGFDGNQRVTPGFLNQSRRLKTMMTPMALAKLVLQGL